MRTRPLFFVPLLAVLFFTVTLAAQQNQISPSASNTNSTIVPKLIKFSGILLDEQGRPMKSPVGVTFALYAQQSEGAALWLETQNVEVDAKGNYTVLLGANSASGIPVELFTSGEARWLGVQAERQLEQPRVLLVSVPYALKAGDAQTLGGLPPSAFMPTQGTAAVAILPTAAASVAATPSAAPSSTVGDPTVTTPGLAVNTVPVADGASDIKNSHITDNGTTVTIGEPLTLPSTGTAVSGSTGGKTSQPFDLFGSTFSSTLATAISQHFRWQEEPVGQSTATPSGKVSLLYALGSAVPAETGFSISSKGVITFASGQTLPTVTGNETVTGNLSANQLTSTVATGTAPLTVNSKTQVANLNASLLGGLPASAFAHLASPNAFTNINTFTANASGSPIVFGTNTSTTGGFADGVHGVANSAGSSGVAGVNASGAIGSIGVFGTSGGFGVFGTSTGPPTSGPVAGVLGQIAASGANLTGSIIGVWGDTGSSNGFGVFGSAGGPGLDGVHGISSNASGSGVAGVNFGGGDGIFGGQVPGGFAGFFSGNVTVTGSLSKGGGSFKIDHPLDPANKYLYHSFVESPDMMNIYNGNVTTDAQGNATVALPDWFEVLNRDFRYQLTVIGQFAQAIVSSEIANGQFSIKTDKPNIKVSWQVTGIRQDAWANAHRIPVEEVKPETERGFYLHPELFGAPLEQGIAARRHPTYTQMPVRPSTLRQDSSANH